MHQQILYVSILSLLSMLLAFFSARFTSVYNAIELF